MLPKIILFITFAIFPQTYGDKKYNTATYYVLSENTRLIDKTPSLEYFVLNVGKPTVTAEIIYGLRGEWIGILQKKVLKHGQSYTFKFKKTVQHMAIRIRNDEKLNAFVHGYPIKTGYPEFDETPAKYFTIDANILKPILVFGAGYIPVVGSALGALIDFFFPINKESAWDQVKNQVEDLVDSKTQAVVEGILQRSLDKINTRLRGVLREIKDPKINNTIDAHYVNIAEDLIGLEKDCVFKGKNSVNDNFFFLPLYVTTINLKVTFYQFGIKNSKSIGLKKAHVERLMYYIFEIVHGSQTGAIAHIHKVCDDKINKEYITAYGGTLFDMIANLRQYCALTGLEHIPRWKAIANNPNVTSKPDPTFVVYSTQFGRNTAEQSAEMVKPISPSLTPEVISGKLNIPKKIIVFLVGPDKIGGMKITLSNGKTVTTGPTISGTNKVEIDFKGKKLTKLTATGNGEINSLEFTFEDGRVITAGKPTTPLRVFSLEKHHIVGFYMTNTMLRVNRNVAVNIAVSYQSR